jgi:hypothetical protein
MGVSLDVLEDRNGDGVPEILVGSGQYIWYGGFEDIGSVCVLSGKSGARLMNLRERDVASFLLAR